MTQIYILICLGKYLKMYVLIHRKTGMHLFLGEKYTSNNKTWTSHLTEVGVAKHWMKIIKLTFSIMLTTP